MSEPGVSGINRPFSWLKRSLQITEKTVAPDLLLPAVRPTVDVFGWERLPEEINITAVASDPAVIVASEATPADVVRLVYAASLEHTDVTVNHICWFIKRRNPGAVDVGLPADRTNIDAGEFASVTRMFFLVEGDFLIAEILGVPVAGQLTLRMNVVDLPIGEYIPPL